ncbi:hypothetical protein J4E83_008261 [Alternaria metachromatica]|uniref:uncharacterized protein n=1 Tax=Alternaria metachromatica TaxID=283354 RepID=UPI0020C4EB03|nr:uncharacterized protein J4E83_008261 [Alternaria metachromatica]KAI4610647.1 hypothetical protein J4E83_008261 [Alternaria metachromatica]
MHFPFSNPVHRQIAQVYSTISNPAETFLLSIPAELRNEIYEYVLVDDEPVLLVENAEDSVIKARGFAGNSAILQTCRQIYHEAIGVLYGQNVFRCNWEVFSERDYFNTVIFDPMETCHQWMQHIGSSLSKLRTIAINMETPDIPADSPGHSPSEDFDMYHSREITILPLLDILWNGVACDLSVRFESSGNPVHPHSDVKLLTKVLYELGKMDALKLKNARRLLRDVVVAPNGKQGTICFLTTSDKVSASRQFLLSEKTREYEVALSQPKFLDLGFNILASIARFALSNHEVTHNFYTGVTSRHAFGMLNVNTQTRLMGLVNFHHRSIIILGSDTLRSSEAMFDGLERRIEQHYNRSNQRLSHCTPIAVSQISLIAPTIVLQFQTDKPLSQAKVRINARDLLRATSVFPAYTTIIVRVCGVDETQDHTTRLGTIRKHVLVLMEHSLRITLAVREPMVEIELNHDCLPVRVTSWGKLGFLSDVRNHDRTVETVDIAWLQEMVRARTWTPERYMHGFVSHDMPKGWDGETRYSLIKCLKNLCS